MVPASDAGQRLPPWDAASQDGFEEQDEDIGLTVRRYFAAIWRYRWLVVCLGVLGVGAGYGLTRVVRPVYEAQATVQVPPPVRGGGGGAVNPLRSAPLMEGLGWVELVRSWAVLDHVVREAKLYLEPASVADSAVFRGFSVDDTYEPGQFQVMRTEDGRVQLARDDGSVLETVAAGDSLGRALGYRWVPGPTLGTSPVEFRLRVPRDAAVLLSEDLGTLLPTDGALLRLSMRGQDPMGTARTLNMIADRFVEVATLLKREKLTTVSEVLRDQLANARVDLTNKETALESFKVRTITMPSDRGANPIATGLASTQDPVREAFFQLRQEREAVVRDRDAIERALAARDDSTESMVVALGTIPIIRQTPELMALLNELTAKRGEARQLRLVMSPDRPELRAKEREVQVLEEETIPAQVGALLTTLNANIAQFDQRIAASSREMQQIPVRVTEENRLERDVEVAQMIFRELQSAYEQARLAELSAAPDVRVLDTAVPPTRPVRDQMLFLLAAASFGGLGLGLGLALVLDRVDRRVRYPEQVTRDLGLPILAAVPLLVGRNGKKSGRAAHESEELVTESIRNLRMGLLYAHGTAGPFLTTISSPGSGDGKSFIALHLARSFARSGRKTLLIDGDNRRGRLHSALGVPRRPGLIDILRGSATLEQVVRTVEQGSFDFIPSGTHLQVAPELLSSEAMTRLMMTLRGSYQAIIIDSPPLGAGVDPIALASHSGTMLLVVRNGVTDRQFAGARLADLQRMPIRILGAALNDVQATGVYKYYAYLPDYRTVDEDDEPASLPSRRSGPSARTDD